MASLYELNKNYEEVLYMLETVDENDAESVQAISDTLEAIEGSIEEKLENTAKVIRILETRNDGITAEMERLKKAKESNARNIARLKQNIDNIMTSKGVEKYTAGTFTFSYPKTTGKTIIDDIELLPKEFVKEVVNYKPLTSEIKEAIKAGGEVPGAHIEYKREVKIK